MAVVIEDGEGRGLGVRDAVPQDFKQRTAQGAVARFLGT